MLYRRSMLVFPDDSGDPGFKVAKGSTPCFVIALVIFDDDLEAEKCAVAIKELRRTLGLSDNYEFRFNGSNRDIRLAFLRCAARLEFRVRAIVMDKARIYGAELRSSKDSFYRYAIKMVLQHNFGKIRNARLRLDGHGDRELGAPELSLPRGPVAGRRSAGHRQAQDGGLETRCVDPVG